MYDPDIFVLDTHRVRTIEADSRKPEQISFNIMEQIASLSHNRPRRLILMGIESNPERWVNSFIKKILKNDIHSAVYIRDLTDISHEFTLTLIKNLFDYVILPMAGTPPIHDTVMGNNCSFRKMVEILPLLYDSSTEIHIFTPIDSRNFSTLPYIFAFLKRYEIKSWEVSINFNLTEKSSPSRSEIVRAILAYLHLAETNGIAVSYFDVPESMFRIENAQKPEKNNDILRQMVSDTKKMIEMEFDDKPATLICDLNSELEVHRMLYINSNDDVFSSPYSKFSLGSLKHEKLIDILSSQPPAEKLELGHGPTNGSQSNNHIHKTYSSGLAYFKRGTFEPYRKELSNIHGIVKV